MSVKGYLLGFSQKANSAKFSQAAGRWEKAISVKADA